MKNGERSVLKLNSALKLKQHETSKYISKNPSHLQSDAVPLRDDDLKPNIIFLKKKYKAKTFAIETKKKLNN